MSRRQHRLNELFGGCNKLCLTVYVCYTRANISAEEFDSLVELYDADSEVLRGFDIPQKDRGESIFNPSFLFKSGENRVAMIAHVQPLYTKTGYINADAIMNDDQGIVAIKKIAQHYIPALERQCEGLVFGDALFAGSDAADYTIDFRYMVHPYDPDICHPANIGRLMPLDIVPGYKIAPVKALAP